MAKYDLVISGAGVVRPGSDSVERLDIAVVGERFVALEPHIPPSDAAEVVNAEGLLAFPGTVDAHSHWGIYNPMEEDAASESRAAAQGGTTTALNYFRTGMYYLNRTGPYEEVFPVVLDLVEGRSYIDYAFHLAPLQLSHIDELPLLVKRFGVPSFKIFMFYGGHGLHGRSDDQSQFLMTPPGEQYDMAHFEWVMRGVQAAREQFPDVADYISLSLHCETAEIMTAYTRIIEESGELHGLEAYSASRPQHSEGLAITIAAYLAHEAGLPNINLLHLSSKKAVEAALIMRDAFPHVDFRREVTIGHLLMDTESANGLYGKVNPPIRPRDDVEFLWQALLSGDIDWVVSDHACCQKEMKMGRDQHDVWRALSGFGGTEYLLVGLYSEGIKRGLSPNRIAELLAWNPSRRFGLLNKGDIAPGLDADLVLLDPNSSWIADAKDSASTQGYTPFEGREFTSQVRDVFVRGHRVLECGNLRGPAKGRYQSRPVTR